MIARILFFLLGFGLSIIGAVYIISYLNLLSLGYNFFDYVNFIIRRVECLNMLVGLIIISLSIFLPGGKYELYI
ncbi:MAG: hypothetical protein RR325_03435 [Bacilli bacterium]